MNLCENSLYQEDLEYIISSKLPWEQLQDSSVVISGASGLIGSCLIDAIMKQNLLYNMNCTLYALGRGEEKARSRFACYWDSKNFQFVKHNIDEPFNGGNIGDVGFVLHMASNTHPVAYATDPIGTITANVFGTKNLLDFAVDHNARRFALVSSNEIYGENRGDVEMFDESYCGYIDCNTMRAGYPESKRCSEALCQAYRSQKNMDVVIPRLTRSYGPTILKSDTKAISQFILKAVAGEDIVLKSAGTQYYSYTYVADAVTGLLTVLLEGGNGEAYNVADISGDITLKDLANIIAGYAGKEVIFELPDDVEKAGYSTATKARLKGDKLHRLGWEAKYDIESGICRTIDILKSV